MVAERFKLLWKFFYPNGDGYNDYWNVKGLLILMETPLFIFSIDFKTN
jgi:gliding motility-associated-like protein